MERQKKAVDKRERERFHGLDITLVREWLNEDGLCLAWFSIGALEMLLTKAGLWEAGKPVAGIRQRVRRLGLERLRRPIVRTSHVNVDVLSGENLLNKARTTAFVHSAEIRVRA